MRAYLLAVVELAILAAVAVVVAVQPAMLDRVMGMPSPDERFLTAAWTGDDQLVDEALADGGSLRARAGDGSNALHFAAWSGRAQLVEWLIAQGLDVNERNNNGWTPLMYASSHDHDRVVRVLLAHGADPAIAVDAAGSDTFDVATNAQATRTRAALREWKRQSGRSRNCARRVSRGRHPRSGS